MAALRVSVVVVSHGRLRALARCLTGLSQLLGNAFEVIVVADRDGLDVVRNLPFFDQVKTIEQSVPNIAKARNDGIAASAGDIVAFIDDDAVPEPTWIQALTRRFETETCDAVSGLVLGRNGISTQWGHMAVDPLGRDRWIKDANDLRPNETVKLHGTNMAVRRSALVELGGFDPSFEFYLDETDLARRLTSSGFSIVFDPKAVVHHGFAASVRRTDARIPLSLFDIGASTAVFLRKHAPPEAWDAALTTLESDQRQRLLRLAKRRKLGAGDMRHLMESLVEGINDGRARDVDRVVPFGNAGPWQPFRTDPTRQMGVTCGWIWQAQTLRHHVSEQVLAGTPQTLLLFEPSPRKHSVQFTQGGWWEHRGGLYGPSKRSESRLQMWRASARFRAELERIAESRGLKGQIQ